MNNDFAIFFLGNGRKGYLERTIASWEANLIDMPKHKIIFDDSNNDEYIVWLTNKYQDKFSIVPIKDNPYGHAGALRQIFNYLKDVDVEYFLYVEEDWMLFRPLQIKKIISTMAENKHILQMRIPRTIWYSDDHHIDLESGSILKHHLDLPRSKWSQKSDWFEWRGKFYFWSHNPSVFDKRILNEAYPLDKTHGQHEYSFGINLLNKYKNGVSGFWAKNIYDAYITHIGIRNPEMLKQISEKEIV